MVKFIIRQILISSATDDEPHCGDMSTDQTHYYNYYNYNYMVSVDDSSL